MACSPPCGPRTSSPTSTSLWIPKPGGWEHSCHWHQVLSLLLPGLLTSFILHLHGTDEDMTARRFAAFAVDECVRRDTQGACEGESLGTRGWRSRPQVAPQPSSRHGPSAECGGSLYAYQRSCLSYCPPRYYGRTQRTAATNTARVCASCHPSCYTCQGASANSCTACPPTHTFDKLACSCSPPQGFLPEEEELQSWRDLLPVLICGSLILSAILYVTYHVAFCLVKGSSCCPRAGRTA